MSWVHASLGESCVMANAYRYLVRCSRMSVACLTVLVVSTSSCQSQEEGDRASSGTGVRNSSSDANGPSTQLFETESGLRCPSDLWESQTIDYASHTVGAGAPVDAAARWIGVEPSDARLGTISSQIDRVRVSFSPDDQLTTIVLYVVNYGSGWIVERVDNCATL